MCNDRYAPGGIWDRLASGAVIDAAYVWLGARRKGYSHNHEAWHLRWH